MKDSGRSVKDFGARRSGWDLWREVVGAAIGVWLIVFLWWMLAGQEEARGERIAVEVGVIEVDVPQLDALRAQLAVAEDLAARRAQKIEEQARIIIALTERVDALEGLLASPEDPPDAEEPIERRQVTGAWVLDQMRGGVRAFEGLRITGGVRVVGEAIHDVSFRGCDFVDASMHLTLYDVRGWTFKNCTFKGATRSDWGHSHGAYMSGVDNFLFEDCVFERNGWLPGNLRFNQNHNVYFDRNVGTVTFRRTKFIEAAAQGVKMRGFQKLVFEDCEFRGNLIDLGGDDRSPAGELIVERCTFRGTGGTDSIGLTLAWSVNLEYRANPLGKVTISDCTWIGPGVAEGPGWSGAIALHLVGSGLARVELIGADFRGWQVRGGSFWAERIRNKIGDRLVIEGGQP